MSNQNCVVFKGNKNGITVMLDESCEFSEITDVLGDKVDDAKKFFGGAKTGISFQGRKLTEEEETVLLNIIAKHANLSISFVSEDIYKGVETKISDNSVKLDQTATYSSKLFSSEHITKYHAGSLRNGQSIRYPGSVVIMGDVNAGAEVIAEGNIIVLGVVKGLVHAGATGNDECFVAAINLDPTQLRIADIITYIPKEPGKKEKKLSIPSYAYIKDGQIYISPL